ncbi:hypothetical protein PR202_ga24526 [Eleusine coracana subsp. coracana]|uniref:Thioesterase domain-containing protein n=1 Tax=Eleusine coracana subsp. coracana TaxID=191504 RepID=A0AAV5D8L5_ELECO|nr:hypothetical protein PR202_ga24526 [Eleusine coracana subsp. coracana]
MSPASPELRAADGRSFSAGHDRLVLTSRERRGRVTALDAAPKSCLLQDAAIAVGKNNRLVDQDTQAVSEFNQLDTARRTSFFEVEMTVGDDDLDEYEVVNNAIYVSYIHIGRDLLLENLGIGVEYWAATGNAMAISELNLKYFTPLRPVQIKGLRMIIHHSIKTLPDRKLVLDARGTIVFLDKGYRPTRVFSDVVAKAWEM